MALFFTRQPLPKVLDISPNLGCDPEFFFTFNGEVKGAEKVLPEKGMKCAEGTFIIDGVQAELNPQYSNCRANLANSIRHCFIELAAELKKKDPNIKCNFSRTVEISEESLMELKEESRRFGCAPSQTIYEDKTAIKITDVDPTKYRTRAAGGHIHIGKTLGDDKLTAALTTDHERTVAMLDLICGNTCVLVDRDVGNIERRKVYGRAGEFRLPPHGLEYRTLSNFWLQSYPLMSMAFSLARLAVQLMASKDKELYYKVFMSKVNMKDVHSAINNNDFDLALSNFKKIEQLIIEVSSDYDRHPINSKTLQNFHYFVDTVKEKGLTPWFPKDPLEHWCTVKEGHAGGFYDFLLVDVPNAKKKAA